MEFRQTPFRGPVRIDVVFARWCQRTLRPSQLQHLHRLAVAQRCYHLAGLLRGVCERRAVPLSATRADREIDRGGAR